MLNNIIKLKKILYLLIELLEFNKIRNILKHFSVLFIEEKSLDFINFLFNLFIFLIECLDIFIYIVREVLVWPINYFRLIFLFQLLVLMIISINNLFETLEFFEDLQPLHPFFRMFIFYWIFIKMRLLDLDRAIEAEIPLFVVFAIFITAVVYLICIAIARALDLVCRY